MRRASLLALALLVSITPQTRAASQDISLGFGSLPSAQGFTYSAVGSHAGTPEATVFSVGGGVLVQNTIGQFLGLSGGSILYSLPAIITTTEPKVLRVRARCLDSDGTSFAPSGEGGFVFGFNTGVQQFAFGLTETRITILTSGGTVVLPTVVDNTVFHDYRFEFTSPSTTQLYRDNVLVHTNTTGFAFASNRLFFGDGTGGANAHGEITEFRFTQGAATAAAPTTWGRVKALFAD
jgi:hypothetical protein